MPMTNRDAALRSEHTYAAGWRSGIWNLVKDGKLSIDEATAYIESKGYKPDQVRERHRNGKYLFFSGR